MIAVMLVSRYYEHTIIGFLLKFKQILKIVSVFSMHICEIST